MWNTPPENVPFDPVLVTLAEVRCFEPISRFIFDQLAIFFLKGLRETAHPFAFVAQTGFKDLLETQDADEKAIAVLPKLIIPIKSALVKLRPFCQKQLAVFIFINFELKGNRH